MADSLFHSLLQSRPHLVADGATGTGLFQRGLETGAAPELWNVDHPDRVRDLHQEYVDAGSDIILTNTFGCTTHRLKLHKAEDRVHELAAAGARAARDVADAAGRPVVVGGSIGPTGELLAPVGALSFEEAVESFAAQAMGLRDGGADVLWVETMSAREEVAAAVAGAARTGLPIVATMTFDTAGRTMMGVSPADAWTHLSGLSPAPDAVGANCGLGPTESVLSLLEMTAIVPDGAVIVAKANCGIPEFRDGKFTFSGTPELMARYARLARDSGARIIGGCCGSDGHVVRAIAEALDGYTPGPRPTREAVIEALGPLAAPPAKPGGGHGKAGRGRRRRQPAARG